jgi:Fe-S oxidoreductase
MCPLAQFGGFSAARILSIQDPETEILGHAEAVQSCLTCGACEIRCPQGVRYTEFVRGLRKELSPLTRRPCPHGEIFQVAARIDPPPDPERLSRWLADDLETSAEGEIGLFVGCLPLFDVVFGEELEVDMTAIARSAISLLNRVGIEPVLVGEELCCGHDLLWNGQRQAFESVARRNSDRFRDRGVRHVITVCAECCRTWKRDYPEVAPDYQPKVEHIAEFLAPRLEAGELALEELDGGSVTYQDPCRLGRHLGVFEAPRQLVSAVPGAELVEMDRAGTDAVCCGTPGFIRCDAVSRQLQAERLASAAATGAERLVTACPKCLIHFRCAQSEDRKRSRNDSNLLVEDLTVFIAGQLADGRPSVPSQPDQPLETGDRP